MLINSVTKALGLLTLVNDSGEQGLSLAEAAARTGQKVPTVFNLLSTLESAGFIIRDEVSKRYFIGDNARQLGLWRTLPMKIAALSRPFLTDLSSDVSETVLLTVLLGTKRLTVLALESCELLRVSAQCGEDERLYDTATGRMMLSGLPSRQLRELVVKLGEPGGRWLEAATVDALQERLDIIRRDGFVDYRLASNGRIRALAVPLELCGSCVPAALGMFYPLERHGDDASAQGYIGKMRACAQAISREWHRQHGAQEL